MKVYIETLGCPKNNVDSESMAAVLKTGGHEFTDDTADADVLIVNTCAFINDAKEESISLIFDMIREKETDENKKVIVTGCLGQRYYKELFEEIPEVDAFMGVNDYENINTVIAEISSGERAVSVHDAPEKYCEIPDRITAPGEVSSYLRIAEGCNNVCTYCIIPQLRGAYRSRRMEDIIEEAEILASRGTRELILIAQDVTAYGEDIYGEYRLHELLERLCAVGGIRWIRMLYCYEDSITDELIETMRREEKICNYIDIPLQHINDNILYNMNRNSTTASIRETIEKLRAAIPDICIRTTFITGFPGEDEDAFEELADFVEETEFERMGVFSYSQEEGTFAAEMPDQIDDRIKDMRRDILMEMQRRISLRHNESMIGKVLEVLVEEKTDDGSYLGRTAYDAPEIDDGVIFTSARELGPGSFVNVYITDAFDYDLAGEAVE